MYIQTFGAICFPTHVLHNRVNPVLLISPEPLEVSFTGDTPVVTGNSVTAQISVSRPVPLQCQIVTRDTVSGEAVILMEEDCECLYAISMNLHSTLVRVLSSPSTTA